jgi:hypothetical protein
VGQALADCPPPVHVHIARTVNKRRKSWNSCISTGSQHPGFEHSEDFRLHRPCVVPAEENKTPVVVFSAFDNEADVSRAFSLGAEDIISFAHDLEMGFK